MVVDRFGVASLTSQSQAALHSEKIKGAAVTHARLKSSLKLHRNRVKLYKRVEA